MAILLKINPEANPDNALHYTIDSELCCDENLPKRDYSLVLDTTAAGNDTIDKVGIDGVEYQFTTSYPTTTTAGAEGIKSEIETILKDLGYVNENSGLASVAVNYDGTGNTLTIQADDSQAVFDWVGAYRPFDQFDPNYETAAFNEYLNSDDVAVPVAGMTLTIETAEYNGQTVTDAIGKAATFPQNGATKANAIEFLQSNFFNALGFELSYVKVEALVDGIWSLKYKTGISSSSADRIPFKLGVRRSDDNTLHEFEQLVGSAVTYKENAVVQNIQIDAETTAF